MTAAVIPVPNGPVLPTVIFYASTKPSTARPGFTNYLNALGQVASVQRDGTILWNKAGTDGSFEQGWDNKDGTATFCCRNDDGTPGPTYLALVRNVSGF